MLLFYFDIVKVVILFVFTKRNYLKINRLVWFFG
nr:MAG TPA: hypothetical protein [Caudoviricetes sp.]